MTSEIMGEVSCRVHLAATVESFTKKDGGAVLIIRELNRTTAPVRHYCTCRMAAEFHIDNVGRVDVDEPFPLFRKI